MDFARAVRLLFGYLVGLLCLAFGLVAIWSAIATVMPYWDLSQRGLWLVALIACSLLTYRLLHLSTRLLK